jgi:hypothetical protein
MAYDERLQPPALVNVSAHDILASQAPIKDIDFNGG